MTTENIFCLHQSPSSGIKQLLWQIKAPPGARPWGEPHLEGHRFAAGTYAARFSLPASGCAPLAPECSRNSKVPRKLISRLLSGEGSIASWIPSFVNKRGACGVEIRVLFSALNPHNLRYWCLWVHFRYWSCWDSCNFNYNLFTQNKTEVWI